jgi:rfaE bifunctional protein kinase chain/domain
VNTSAIKDLFERFRESKVLIIGDSMIDAYMWGHIERMSPEAPVPVVRIDRQERKLGGAANVARNIKRLGAYPILLSVLGKDEQARNFLDLMQKEHLNTEGILELDDRPTTVKTRVIHKDEHVLRVDEESQEDIHDTSSVLQLLSDILEEHQIDVVIFQDYNKGLLTAEFIKESISIFRDKGIPMVVDPKRRHFLSYKGVDLFKPNFKEMSEGLDLNVKAEDDTAVLRAMHRLQEELNSNTILLTRSEYGIAALNNDESFLQKAFDRNILDVSGAGDSVISVAALALAANMDLKGLATIANLAGGLACEEVGVHTVDPDRLASELEKFYKK